jgi:hypothetical protein
MWICHRPTDWESALALKLGHVSGLHIHGGCSLSNTWSHTISFVILNTGARWPFSGLTPGVAWHSSNPFFFTVALIISHYVSHCLSLSPFLSLPSGHKCILDRLWILVKALALTSGSMESLCYEYCIWYEFAWGPIPVHRVSQSPLQQLDCREHFGDNRYLFFFSCVQLTQLAPCITLLKCDESF